MGNAVIMPNHCADITGLFSKCCISPNSLFILLEQSLESKPSCSFCGNRCYECNALAKPKIYMKDPC